MRSFDLFLRAVEQRFRGPVVPSGEPALKRGPVPIPLLLTLGVGALIVLHDLGARQPRAGVPEPAAALSALPAAVPGAAAAAPASTPPAGLPTDAGSAAGGAPAARVPQPPARPASSKAPAKPAAKPGKAPKKPPAGSKKPAPAAPEAAAAAPAPVATPPAGAPAPSPVLAAPQDPELQPLSDYRAPGAAALDPNPGGLAAGVLVKLIGIVLLIVGCAAGWRRLQGWLAVGTAAPARQPVEVTTTVALAPQRLLHLVNVEGQRLLLASVPGQVSLIARLEPPPPVIETVVSPALPGEQLAALEQLEAGEPAAPERFEDMLKALEDFAAHGPAGPPEGAKTRSLSPQAGGGSAPDAPAPPAAPAAPGAPGAASASRGSLFRTATAVRTEDEDA